MKTFNKGKLEWLVSVIDPHLNKPIRQNRIEYIVKKEHMGEQIRDWGEFTEDSSSYYSESDESDFVDDFPPTLDFNFS
jgi:hypothetical protein